MVGLDVGVVEPCVGYRVTVSRQGVPVGPGVGGEVYR